MDPAVSQHYARNLLVTPLDEDGQPLYSVDGNKITFHRSGVWRLQLGRPFAVSAGHVMEISDDEAADHWTAPVTRSTTDCTIVANDTRTQVALGDRELPEVFTTHNLGANVEVIVRRTSGPRGSTLVDMMINGGNDDERKELQDQVANLERRLRDAGRFAHIQANRLQVLAGHIDKNATGWTVDSVRKHLRDLANDVCDVQETHGMHVDTHRDDEPVRRLAHAMTESANQLGHVAGSGIVDSVRAKLEQTVDTWTTEAQRRPWATLGHPRDAVQFVYQDSGASMPDTLAEPHMSIHLQDGASTKPQLACRHYAHHHGADGCTLCDCTAPRTTFTDKELAEKLCENATYRTKPPLITAEQIAACAEANESVPWSLRQWALMAKKCMDAQANNLEQVHSLLTHLDSPQGAATKMNAHAIEMLRQTVGYYPDDEEAMQAEHDDAIANRIAVDKLATTMRMAADGLKSAYCPGRPPYLLATIIDNLRAEADAWTPVPEDESDQDGLNLSDIQVPRGPIAYPVASWSVPMGRVTRANHAGCEHVLELHAERSGCQVDDCPCKATLSGLREWLTSGHADLMPGEPHSTGPEETEALQQPREGTPIVQRFAEVVAVLEDAAKAMRAVQVRLAPGDRARLGLSLARVQKLLGQ